MRKTLGVLVCVAGLLLSQAAHATTQQEADALLASQSWDEAGDAYEILLRQDRDNASNWFNLARARHQAGELAAARRAYLNALARNHPAPGRVRYHLARALMSLGRRAEAMREIQQLIGTTITGRQLLSASEFAPLLNTAEFQAVVERQTPCNTAEYRQFDFWLGEWDIVPFAPSSPAGGQNSITSAQQGCVIVENYTTQGGFSGMSINFYDASRGVWHQTWMGSGGGSLYLEGGINSDGAMELSDRNLPSATASAGTINRTIWTPLPDGQLRQHWEVSSDNGATWTTVFDGRYVRRAEE